GLLSQIRQNYPALPQPEPLFGVVRVAPDKFNSLLKSQRNIIISTHDSAWAKQGNFHSAEDHYFKIKRNVFAKGQLVVVLNPFITNEALADSLSQYGNRIVDVFETEEEARNNQFLNKVTDKAIVLKFRNEFSCYLPIPDDYRIGKETKDFVWLINEQAERIFNITLHKSKYKGPSDFDEENIIAKRNELGKKNIPGSFEGSHLSTESNYKPYRDTVNIDGNFAILTRGLWRMEGDFMGGPYVNLTIYDDRDQSVYFIDGFVFAPKFKKRELIKNVERILRAFKTIEPKK
ncbi:MAG: hypothetical protein ACI9WO_002251, partial [Sphingobacteriales bacterium]